MKFTKETMEKVAHIEDPGQRIMMAEQIDGKKKRRIEHPEHGSAQCSLLQLPEFISRGWKDCGEYEAPDVAPVEPDGKPAEEVDGSGKDEDDGEAVIVPDLQPITPENLELNKRTVSELKAAGIETLGALCEAGETDEGRVVLVSVYGINDENIDDLLDRAEDLRESLIDGEG